MLPLRVILHPTDFSDRSQCAFELACRLARDSGAELIVVHVVQPPPFVTHGEMAKALQQAEGYRRESRMACRTASLRTQYRMSAPTTTGIRPRKRPAGAINTFTPIWPKPITGAATVAYGPSCCKRPHCDHGRTEMFRKAGLPRG